MEGCSVHPLSMLHRCIWYWLEHPPCWEHSFSTVHHLICDGTFLQHRTGIYAMMNADTKQLIYASYDLPEGGSKLLAAYRRRINAYQYYRR
jgi:hypothetical protein